MKQKYILVACEESQTVAIAFREMGFMAFSCDLQACSGGHPEYHVQGDVLRILNGGSFKTMDGKRHHIQKWNLVIAHPPCTYLANSGSPWLYRNGKIDNERLKKGMEGKRFFMQFLLNCTADHICIENPTPTKIYNLPMPTQAIQPYEYGHAFSKRTCLWLKNLPCLKPTQVVEKHECYTLSKGIRSAKMRSKTFKGIALAMASQWANCI